MPINNNFEDDNVIDIGSKFDKFKRKGKNFIALIVVIVIALILLFQSFYIVESGKNAVVLRFGRVANVEKEAGLKFKLPFIDAVKMVDVQRKYKVEYGYRTVQKGTEHSEPVYKDVKDEGTIIVDAANNNASIVLIDLYVQYKVSDPVNYLFKVDDLDGTLRIALEEVIRATFQSHTLDEARTDKETIDKEIMPALQKKMSDYKAGLKIVQVQTANAQLLPAVQEAYQQKENANQYKKGKLEEAEKYENTILPQARGEAVKLEEDAEGYKAEVVANANANVAQYNALYTEYLKNPKIVKEKYFVETMEKFLKNNKVIIDETKNGQIYKFFNMDEKQNPIKATVAEQGKGK